MSSEIYKQFFLEADTDKSGFLTLNELIYILTKKGYTGGEARIRKIFSGADKSGDNKITFEEYMVAMNQQPDRNHKEASVRSVFRQFDKDGSGSIDKAELKQVFQELGRTLSEQEVNKLMAMADKDGSGSLNYEEFIKEVFGRG